MNTPIASKKLIRLLNEQKLVTLYSIHPEYSKLIFSGKKKIELRKKLPKTKHRIIAIYETAPTKKVIGLCEVSNYYDLPIKDISKFIKKAKINKNFVFNYYKNKQKFTAIEINKYYTFKTPLSIGQFSQEKRSLAPQSFYYVPINLSLILSLF